MKIRPFADVRAVAALAEAAAADPAFERGARMAGRCAQGGGDAASGACAGLSQWTEDQIVAALTLGVRPDGSPMPAVAPWRPTVGMTEAEARALARWLTAMAPTFGAALSLDGCEGDCAV
jgi:hypothetical protein